MAKAAPQIRAGVQEEWRGSLTGLLPLGAGLGPEGSPGAQLAYSRGSCSTHWKSLCEAWRPIQRSKFTSGRLAVMNANSPQKRVVSDRGSSRLLPLVFWGGGEAVFEDTRASPWAGPTLF